MPGPSEPRAQRALRHLRIGKHLPDAVTRSYLADGRVVGWYGDPGVVIDGEIATQSVPRALAARFGAGSSPSAFWTCWTQAECAAKLANIPITLWISEHGLDSAGHDVITVLHEDVVVSVGFREILEPLSFPSAMIPGNQRPALCSCPVNFTQRDA